NLGWAGRVVTITGSGLAGRVTFKGSTPVSSTGSGTEIRVAGARGATTRPISVSSGGGRATSAASLTIAAVPPTPEVSAVSPRSGRAGTGVTRGGSKLDRVTGVSFGGVVAPAVQLSATRLVATVPP